MAITAAAPAMNDTTLIAVLIIPMIGLLSFEALFWSLQTEDSDDPGMSQAAMVLAALVVAGLKKSAQLANSDTIRSFLAKLTTVIIFQSY